tara:strand:- start:5913 stop:6176 length:264 start_codon:yes stop_codon:yes gene_type:complete
MRGKHCRVLPNFQLLQAIKSNCLSDFDDAVSRGAASSARDLDGRSALEVAFRHSRPDLARRLIQNGADPNPIFHIAWYRKWGHPTWS